VQPTCSKAYGRVGPKGIRIYLKVSSINLLVLLTLVLKIVSICVSLGEYPIIRYHNPQNSVHEASVLCSHLARFVQLELDQYAKFHEDFPPPSPRPRGALIITDRSMDLFAPLLHEFTYQAMVHDLLPLVEGDKVYYKTSLNEAEGSANIRDVELGEKDNIWVKNRHLHMKDLLEKLASDFQAFKAKNPQFAERFVIYNATVPRIRIPLTKLPSPVTIPAV